MIYSCAAQRRGFFGKRFLSKNLIKKSAIVLMGIGFAGGSNLVFAQVHWEDYRGTSAVPASVDPLVTSKPTFDNNTASAITNLKNLLAASSNGSGAVRSGNSPNIDWATNSYQLCTMGVSASAASCAVQAMGRVAYTTIRFPQAGVYTLQVAHDDDILYELSADYTTPDFRSVNYGIPVGQFSRWTANDNTFNSFGNFTSPKANSCARMRVYWANGGGIDRNRLQWIRPDKVTEIVPSSAFLEPDGSQSSECSSAIYVAGLQLTKVGTLSSNESEIKYSFTVQNTGDTNLSNIKIADPLLPSLVCQNISSLAAGATAGVVCTAGDVYAVKNSDRDQGGVNNTATATGTDINGFPIAGSSSVVVKINQAPAISIAKRTSSSGPFTLGSVISYQFVVTNSGNVTLSNIVVNDQLPNLGAINCPAKSLSMGESMTCSADYKVQQSDVKAGKVHNSATASGVPPASTKNPTPAPVTSPPGSVDTIIHQLTADAPISVPVNSWWMLGLLFMVLSIAVSRFRKN